MYGALLTTEASYRNSNMLSSSLLYAILPARGPGGECYPFSPSSERSVAGSHSIHGMGLNRPRPTASSYLYKVPQTRLLKSKTNISNCIFFGNGEPYCQGPRNRETISVAEDLSPRRHSLKVKNNSVSLSLLLVARHLQGDWYLSHVVE